MSDAELLAKLDTLEAKVDRAYVAAETVRKYLFWTGVITLALIIIPLIGLAFAVPQFIDTYGAGVQGLGL